MAEKTKSSLEKVIQTAIDSALEKVHTCLPARVIKFDSKNQLIDAQITIQKKLAGELVNFPLLVNVPIRYWRSKTFSITFPIEIGDHVKIFFAEKSIDTWLLRGGIQNPFDVRKFDLSDAFAEPVMYHQKNIIPDFSPKNLEIKTNSGDTKIIIKADEEVEITTTGKATITASKDIDINTSADINIDASKNVNINASKNANVNTTGDTNINTTGDTNITASKTIIIDAPLIKLGAAAIMGVSRVGDITSSNHGDNHTHTLLPGSLKVLTE